MSVSVSFSFAALGPVHRANRWGATFRYRIIHANSLRTLPTTTVSRHEHGYEEAEQNKKDRETNEKLSIFGFPILCFLCTILFWLFSELKGLIYMDSV